MKEITKNCLQCNEETIHRVGKKQATTRSSAYTRREVSFCIQCGRREIKNRTKGARTISGKNHFAKSELNEEDKNDK